MVYRHIACAPITPNIGAEIAGVHVGSLSAAQAAEIRSALTDRKVVVFRDQAITAQEYVAFMRIFGAPVREDLVAQDGCPPEVGAIHIAANERQKINFWHMDHSFRATPSPILSLYARLLPPCGGDTLFTSLEAAYDGLADDLKQRIEGLETHHKATPTQNTKRRYTGEQIEAMRAAPAERHPLAALNPENGRKYLFVNVPIYCRGIVGREDPDGDALLRKLYRHVQRPEFHFRLVWRPNTLVVWENIHCLHYPVADYFPHERKLWRVVIKGVDRPLAA